MTGAGSNKPKYEPPALMPLGELARGLGVGLMCACWKGSSVHDGCYSGQSPAGGCSCGGSAGSCKYGKGVS